MRKYILDLTVRERTYLGAEYVLLKLTRLNEPLPAMFPGQFAELKIGNTSISVKASETTTSIGNSEAATSAIISENTAKAFESLTQGNSLECKYNSEKVEMTSVETIGTTGEWQMPPLLRRPISIHYVDYAQNEVWFLVRIVGTGTRMLGVLQEGDIVNVMLPLGNGFTLPAVNATKLDQTLQMPSTIDTQSFDNEQEAALQTPLLIGGGVGIAPLLYLGKVLRKQSVSPTFLLGARTERELQQLEEFEQFGTVYTTTEDGSHGEQGFVTQHSVLQNRVFSQIYCCGPLPMMKAVASYAKEKNIPCEVSLENRMACGIGACLCCVENTTQGHQCVCTDGPVFNTKDLLWQI